MPVLSSRIVGSDRKRFDFNDSSICLALAAIYFLKSIPEGEIGGAISLLGVDPKDCVEDGREPGDVVEEGGEPGNVVEEDGEPGGGASVGAGADTISGLVSGTSTAGGVETSTLASGA